MAWRCGGRSNQELIDNMMRNGLINAERVANVKHLQVDRYIAL